MATNTEKPIIHQVIREMIEANEKIRNGDIAEEASRRVGRPIRLQDISHLRGEIGLNRYQLSERRAREQVLLTFGVQPAEFDQIREPDRLRTAAPVFPKHAALGTITDEYRDTLNRWASHVAKDILEAAQDGRGKVALRLCDLLFDPDLIYACLWHASNAGVEVQVVPFRH